MNLDIDIGNTRLKWRLRNAQGYHGVIETQAVTAAELMQAWRGLPRPQRVRFVSVASVEAEQAVEQSALQQWGITAEKARSQALQAGVANSYQNFSTLGADRWLAMLAGYNYVGGACCVVDCGSAVTVDYITADGQHLGGYIAPGLRLMRKGLLSNTRQINLPHEVQGRFDTAPGRSTGEAVGHGIELMMAALAQRVVRDCPQLLGGSARLLVTGGDGDRFLDAAGSGEWCPDLVMDGLDWALPDTQGG